MLRLRLRWWKFPSSYPSSDNSGFRGKKTEDRSQETEHCEEKEINVQLPASSVQRPMKATRKTQYSHRELGGD